MHKDLGLFLDSAASNRVPVPATAAVRQCYELARAAGKGEEDIGAVITVFEQLVGTEISSQVLTRHRSAGRVRSGMPRCTASHRGPLTG